MAGGVFICRLFSRMIKRCIRKTVVAVGLLVLTAVILWLLDSKGLLILTPKINGTVTVHQNGESETFRFSARGGEYGDYDWSLGSKEMPISVHLFSRNSWHVVNMNFDIERLETDWHITGTVNVKTYNPVSYEDSIPLGEPIRITVDCFP